MLSGVNARRWVAWSLLLAVAGVGSVLALGSYFSYTRVARAVAQARAVQPVFVAAHYSAEDSGIDVEISFRFDTHATSVPIKLEALAYTLVVLDPDGTVVSEGHNSARGVYVGRYSYWGGGQLLNDPRRIFRSPSVMRSLYRDKLTAELHAGHREMAALGEATLAVETNLGWQTLAVPFSWRFSLAVGGGK